MKIVNSMRQDMEKYEQLKAFARAEIGYCYSRMGPEYNEIPWKGLTTILDGKNLHHVLRNQGITFGSVG